MINIIDIYIIYADITHFIFFIFHWYAIRWHLLLISPLHYHFSFDYAFLFHWWHDWCFHFITIFFGLFSDYCFHFYIFAMSLYWDAFIFIYLSFTLFLLLFSWYLASFLGFIDCHIDIFHFRHYLLIYISLLRFIMITFAFHTPLFSLLINIDIIAIDFMPLFRRHFHYAIISLMIFSSFYFIFIDIIDSLLAISSSYLFWYLYFHFIDYLFSLILIAIDYCRAIITYTIYYAIIYIAYFLILFFFIFAFLYLFRFHCFIFIIEPFCWFISSASSIISFSLITITSFSFYYFRHYFLYFFASPLLIYFAIIAISHYIIFIHGIAFISLYLHIVTPLFSLFISLWLHYYAPLYFIIHWCFIDIYYCILFISLLITSSLFFDLFLFHYALRHFRWFSLFSFSSDISSPLHYYYYLYIIIIFFISWVIFMMIFIIITFLLFSHYFRYDDYIWYDMILFLDYFFHDTISFTACFHFPYYLFSYIWFSHHFHDYLRYYYFADDIFSLFHFIHASWLFSFSLPLFLRHFSSLSLSFSFSLSPFIIFTLIIIRSVISLMLISLPLMPLIFIFIIIITLFISFMPWHIFIIALYFHYYFHIDCRCLIINIYLLTVIHVIYYVLFHYYLLRHDASLLFSLLINTLILSLMMIIFAHDHFRHWFSFLLHDFWCLIFSFAIFADFRFFISLIFAAFAIAYYSMPFDAAYISHAIRCRHIMPLCHCRLRFHYAFITLISRHWLTPRIIIFRFSLPLYFHYAMIHWLFWYILFWWCLFSLNILFYIVIYFHDIDYYIFDDDIFIFADVYFFIFMMFRIVTLWFACFRRCHYICIFIIFFISYNIFC